MPLEAAWKIAPTIQIRAAIWIEFRRDSLSAMNDEDRAPKSEPAGIAAVIPPWRVPLGLPK